MRALMIMLQASFLGAWTLFWIIVALITTALTRRRRYSLTLARRVWAPVALRVLGVRLEVTGVGGSDIPQPCLFVANHESFVDIPVLFRALPVPLRFLAKVELRRVPFVAQFITAMGMVFVDRGDSEAARESIEQVTGVLRSGACLVAFPEGTRSRTGEVRPFKTGAFVAAIKARVPVVPVRIRGGGDVLPPGGFSPRPGRVMVVVGEPIHSSGLSLEDRRALADQAQLSLAALGSEC